MQPLPDQPVGGGHRGSRRKGHRPAARASPRVASRSRSRAASAVGSPGIRASEAAAVVALAVIGALTVWTVTARQWRAWGYAEREADLLVRRGVLVWRLSVVPYGRMQFVDVTAGPVDRWLGLATVHMHTAAAASDARIPG